MEADGDGFILATIGLIAGNHNDAYQLKRHLKTAFKAMKRLGLTIQGAFFNADKAFDNREARKTCFNHGLILNMDENIRNRKATKRGRTRLFNPEVYKHRGSLGICVKRPDMVVKQRACNLPDRDKCAEKDVSDWSNHKSAA